MDFNDLNSRLQRLYSSLGQHISVDVGSNIIDKREQLPDGKFLHITSFGNDDLIANQNTVMNSIHHIASLKDIIKTKLKQAGKDGQLYEQLIDDNFALSLVTDLDNSAKHGTPLTKHKRTDCNPSIANIEQSLRGKGITTAEFRTDLVTGKTELVNVEGDVTVILVADVIDSKGQILMSLNTMMEDSVQLVESFIKINQLSNK